MALDIDIYVQACKRKELYVQRRDGPCSAAEEQAGKVGPSAKQLIKTNILRRSCVIITYYITTSIIVLIIFIITTIMLPMMLPIMMIIIIITSGRRRYDNNNILHRLLYFLYAYCAFMVLLKGYTLH